jgi:ergothioneine biosynthesis protein EgtB
MNPSLETLRHRLEAAWKRSDEIFAILKPGAYLERPIALRQPFIFYLGHLPAFAWNQVWRGLLRRPSFNEAFDRLFERGIDPVGVDEAKPAARTDWPHEHEVLAYRGRVRDTLRATFDDVAALAAADSLADHGRVYHVAVEHELMHHETLLYMFHQLDLINKVRPARLPGHVVDGAAPARTVRVPGGSVHLGASFDRLDFGWDNEFPEQRVEVGPFTMDATPVRNGEYFEFLSSGGYDRPELWSAEAREWLDRTKVRHPAFWSRNGGGWVYHTQFEVLPLERVGDWPVYASWAEASAYARWKGLDLPTESEFHRAAYGAPDGRERRYPWGDEAPSPERGTLDFSSWTPTPVGSRPAGASAWGVLELVGNGWEWTSSVFAPFPGFTPYLRTYPGYSADFFDGQHYVMLGASWATGAGLVRRSFRNWFQPHYPYVYAKFRCVSRG